MYHQVHTILGNPRAICLAMLAQYSETDGSVVTENVKYRIPTVDFFPFTSSSMRDWPWFLTIHQAGSDNIYYLSNVILQWWWIIS